MSSQARAVIIDRPGGIDRLRLRTITVPGPAENQVEITVAFAGCNWADTQIRQGVYPHPISYPHVLGREVSGTVTRLGVGVTDLEVGQRVCALVSGGGYAERVVASREAVIPLPDEVSLESAAAFPVQALTAFHMLHTISRVNTGDVVLCHAIGGGVGSYVTQLATHAGATVLGTVGTDGKEDLPLRLGARRVINSRREDFVAEVMAFTGGDGVDLAIDSLGASTLDRTFELMKPLAHVINIGEAEGIPYDNIRDRLLPKSLTFTRFHLRHVGMDTPRWQRGVREVVDLIAEGKLLVPVSQRFALDQAPEMHRTLEGRSTAGKLLLEISPSTDSVK